MEGVMMRSPHAYCVAVRKPDGSMLTEEAILLRPSDRNRIWKLPLLRGCATLGQAMWLGIKALRFSTNVMVEAEQGHLPEKERKEMPAWAMTLNLAVSFLFFIFLYKFVPLLITTRLGKIYPELQGRVAFNAVDGIIRIALFLGFLYLISRWKDIHRVFEYHGAEHKVVFNFESGQPLSVENAQKFVTWHPRCGTSFLLVVMMVSMAVYTLLPFDTFLLRFISRIVLLPVIAGLSYEMIRFAAKHRGGLLALLTAPGLWLQRITTQPPDDSQTGVAIHALEGAMALEKEHGGELVIA